MIAKHTLTINNISKSYEEIVALSSLSLTINKGEKVALIGPSGSGKSSLLNSIIKNINLDSGHILIGDIDINSIASVKEYAKLLGIISQSFDLVGQLSVLQNVLVGRFKDWGNLSSLKSLFIPRDKDIALDALKKVGMLEHVSKEVRHLSGGQKQRVAIARLIVQEPHIILADEPVASLDQARADDIIKLLISMSDYAGSTLIASLHSVDLSLKYFDRIVAIKDGSLMYDVKAKDMNKEMIEKLYKLEVDKDES